MSESEPKSRLYHEVLTKKKILHVHKKGAFNFEFPKMAFDRICKFYGHEILRPNSFVVYHTMHQTTEIKKLSSVSHQLGEKEITNVLNMLTNFVIIPKEYEDYDDVKKLKLAPKIDDKIMKNIAKKAGMQWDFMIDYFELQEVTTEVKETSKITITYEIVENVFKLIPLLKVIFVNGESTEFTYYSLKSILEKSGIKLENVLPYLKNEIKDIDRIQELAKEMPLYEKVKIRELKDRIKKGDLKEQSLDIYLGMDSCNRYNKIPFDLVQNDENEASTLLNELIEKVENKKTKFGEYYENIDNQIIEIKDKSNKTVFIRKKIFDEIISDPETEFDEYKTYDISDNEITISKKEITTYKENPTLIKIYNKNSKEEYIFIIIEEIKNDLTDFTYVRQEKTFKGKNISGEDKEETWTVMDVEFEDLPILDESKPLYTIPEKSQLLEKTKTDLLNEIKNIDVDNKENKDDKNETKDFTVYKVKNKYLPVRFVKEIKERDKNIKNKNIKYQVKSVVNKDETITVEYEDIFGEETFTEYVLMNNEENPDEPIIVEKGELYTILNGSNNSDDVINIKNELNNKEMKVKLNKVKFIRFKVGEAPKNYEETQEEVKKSITPETFIIKSNNCFIKKDIVTTIIESKEEYDTYYVKDIANKTIKVSKKQLIKDVDDEDCQFVSIISEEEPDNNIIVSYKEIITQLESDPMEEYCILKDKDGKPIKIKKQAVKTVKIKCDAPKLDEQPNKIKADIIKDIQDYYYLYKDPDNNSHYIRGDTLKLIKTYNSKFPVDNFEVEDHKNNKCFISKETATKLLDDPNSAKYICLENEEDKDEPIMAEYTMLQNAEGDSDEPIPINKEGKKIKLQKVKLIKIKPVDSLGEQPEEKNYEIIENLLKILQKNSPLSDIYKVQDAQDKEIFIYEETLNKIEENKADPEKTTYKATSPLKEEVTCGKKIKKTPNKYIKIVHPKTTIFDKAAYEKSLKEFKVKQKTIKIKDVKNEEIEVDPLTVKIYEATPEEAEITKILPADFSDINEKLLLDIVPQNKLLLLNDNNKQPCIINKRLGDNLVKYPKTKFDTFTLNDKNGKKIKVSRKIVEKANKDNNCEYIEILDNTNDENKNEFIPVGELLVALKDKENEDFETKNKDGKKIKLNKKKIKVVKQTIKFGDVPQQGEEIKAQLLSDIKDSYIKLKDSKNNKDIIVRYTQLEQVNSHKQKAPFVNYEILDNKKEKVYTTKTICQKISSIKDSEKLILCYDESQSNNEFLVPLDKIQNSNCDGDDEFEIGEGKKILFKNLKIKKLDETPKMGVQPEEEKMLNVLNLINKINSGSLNKNYKTKDANGNVCFVSNNYIKKLQTESKNDEKDTKYNINDAFGKNKITLIKTTVDKDNKPGDYVLINSTKDNKDYLVELKDLVNNLKKFKSTDDDINVVNAADGKPMKLNPLEIEIVPPYNYYPFDKIVEKKILPIKIDDIRSENEKKEENKPDERKGRKEEDQNDVKQRIRLRSAPARQHNPEKKSYKIRRAIIYKKQRKDK